MEKELEGKHKDASDNLTEDHPRFKQIYGQMKEFERKLEDSTKVIDEQKDAMDAMKTHNEQLATNIKDTVVKKEQAYLSAIETQIADAVAEGDTAQVVILQGQLFDAKIAQINKPAPTQTINTKEIVDAVRAELGTNKNADLFEDWKIDNPWYNQDENARIYADGLAGKIEKDNPTISYSKLLDDVAKQSKEFLNIEAVEEVGSAMAGRSNESTNTQFKGGKIILSANDRMLMKMFNMSEEDMLTQKKITLAEESAQ